MTLLNLLLLVITLSLLGDAAPAPLSRNISEAIGGETNTENVITRKWISQIMSEELPHFMPHSSTNEECNRQAEIFKKHLANLTLWAVQMYDASVFSEFGLIYGNEFTNGQYDQCVQVNVPQFEIKGKYCHAYMQVSPTYYNTKVPQNLLDFKSLSPFSSAWAKIQKVGDNRVKHRDRFYWGLCIPIGCTRFDLEESLKALLVPAFNKSEIITDIILDESACSVAHNDWNISTGGYVFLIITFGLTLLVIVATLAHAFFPSSFDEEKKDSGVLLAFSVIGNTKQLLKPETTPELRTISGMKVLSMVLVIYGHRMLMTTYWPLVNVEDREKVYDNYSEILNLNGAIIVNTFLFATGFLVYNKIIVDIQKGRKIHIPLYIFYRWARVVPVYLFLICGMIFVKPFFQNEPLYKREAAWRVEACTNNWWTHILFINNYYNADTECILPAWYLAVDMQLYVVGVITGYIMSKSRIIAYVILGFLFGASEIIPAIITYIKGYGPVLRMYINWLDAYYKQDDYVYSYIPTHMRATPYIMGMLTALVLEKLKKMEYSFPKYQRIVGLIACIGCFAASMFYAWVFYDTTREPSLLENSLYVSFHRLGWSLFAAWIIVSGSFHNSKITGILRINFFAPLNKLMLNALLVHTLIQGEVKLQQRQSDYVNLFIMLWATAGDVLTTYICSYILHLLISGPFSRLQDLTLRKLFGKKK